MLTPYKLAVRLFVAIFKIVGYAIAGICEAAWYVIYGRRDRIGAAVGETLRGIVNALADVFHA